jgi:large subunit ribosomal protein L9
VKVILTKDVPNLGHAGDAKDVAAGYARNYLFREGLAVKASGGAMKDFERRRAADARREEKMTARAEALAKQLEGITLTFEARAGETGHLYGSITPSTIAEALERPTQADPFRATAGGRRAHRFGTLELERGGRGQGRGQARGRRAPCGRDAGGG